MQGRFARWVRIPHFRLFPFFISAFRRFTALSSGLESSKGYLPGEHLRKCLRKTQLVNRPFCRSSFPAPRDAMISTAFARGRTETSTASLSWAGQVPRCGRECGKRVTYRSLHHSPTGQMPIWMASPHQVFSKGERHRWMTVRLRGHGLDEQVEASQLTAKGMGDSLSVRGGAVAAAAPLGALLFVSACLSAVIERRTKGGALVGAPLLSFGMFCILSNLNLVPATHAVYDLCWSLLLPLSLSIIILGNPVVSTKEERQSGQNLLGEAVRTSEPRRESAGPIGRVGLSFLIGAVGSIVGVTTSFRVATTYGGWAIALPRDTAAQIAGALTATYVGGSVNLFAVASSVGLIGATSVGGSSILGALAAADIFLMSVYFSFLVAADKTPLFRRMFPGKTIPVERRPGPTLELPGGKSGVKPSGVVAPKYYGWRRPFRSHATATSALFVIGSAICFMSNTVACISPLPGTSTMLVTFLTVVATRGLSWFAPDFQVDLSRTAPFVATVLLNAFFGSVGASGRWLEVVGVAPAVFVFASLALAVHVVFMAIGATALNRCCGAGLSIDDLIVASNANIGGPSTAATFAGLIGKADLVIPAAVWGTVGYAIATSLGVGVWAILR